MRSLREGRYDHVRLFDNLQTIAYMFDFASVLLATHLTNQSMRHSITLNYSLSPIILPITGIVAGLYANTVLYFRFRIVQYVPPLS